MKLLRDQSPVVIVIAALFVVGCGVDDQSDRVGGDAPVAKGDAEEIAVVKEAAKKAVLADHANEDVAAKKSVSESIELAAPEVALTLENSKFSVVAPIGWTKTMSPDREKYLGMSSPADSSKGHNPVVLAVSVIPRMGSNDPERVFKFTKRRVERLANIDTERMQQVAGHDALRLEMTMNEPDDEDDVTRSIEVTVPLDEFTLLVSSKGSADETLAVTDQIDEIIESIKLK